MTTPAAEARLAELVTRVTEQPNRLPALFPAVARLVGRGPTDPEDRGGLLTLRVEDEARVALLAAAAGSGRLDADQLAALTTELYEDGDGDERRAVLRALDRLDALDPRVGRRLVEDALRSNDPRLIAAAMGRFAARHLGADAWRHGVLKCLFVGVPLAAVTDWAARVDSELVRMTADFTAEREAAGRTVPEDARRILASPRPGQDTPEHSEDPEHPKAREGER
ncbi:EboA domain-containing protein [Streptomyces mayteni]